jgi:metal-dependent amidase/aminoacylase/carboxypeptidase family protein
MFIKKRVLALSGILAIAASAAGQNTAPASDLSADVQQQLTALTETYKHLHRNPELSRHEEKTSAFLAEELRKLGYSVTEHVGRYTDGSQADGVVAVMEDSPGPRLLIRTDMDALPVEEKTGLNYASTLRSTNEQGRRSASCTPAGMTCT